jgi:hypothetical protein
MSVARPGSAADNKLRFECNRATGTCGGPLQVVAIPLDGDLMLMYYRYGWLWVNCEANLRGSRLQIARAMLSLIDLLTVDARCTTVADHGYYLLWHSAAQPGPRT